MAKSHDRAARIIARKVGGTYNSKSSPDVKGGKARVEVKSKASEIGKALSQLGGGAGPAFVALPKPALKSGQERIKGRKTGLMDHQGKIVKPSTRKRK